MNLRQTHTYATLEVTPATFDEIAAKLRAAGYDHAFDLEERVIDMQGIGVMKSEMVAPSAEHPDVALLREAVQAVDEARVDLIVSKEGAAHHAEEMRKWTEALDRINATLFKRDGLVKEAPVAPAPADAADSEMTVVYVVRNFGDQVPIGQLRIRTDALPPTPTYCFALGFMALEVSGIPPGSVPMAPYVNKYQLTEVAIVSDDAYAKYLRQIGVIYSENNDAG